MTAKARIPVIDKDISKGDIICWLCPNTGTVIWNEDVWKVKALTDDFREKYAAGIRKSYYDA